MTASLIVCSLRDAPAAARQYDPEVAISLVGYGEAPRLRSERCTHHHIQCADVLRSRGALRAPDAHDVGQILDAADTWTGARPMLIHCHAGRSRSWAAALIVARHLTDEAPSAIVERMLSLAPWADPHTGMLELADTCTGEPDGLAAAMLSTHVLVHSSMANNLVGSLLLMPLKLRRKAADGIAA